MPADGGHAVRFLSLAPVAFPSRPSESHLLVGEAAELAELDLDLAFSLYRWSIIVMASLAAVRSSYSTSPHSAVTVSCATPKSLPRRCGLLLHLHPC